MTTWKELNIDVSNVNTNQGKTLCPKCSHIRENKSDPCLSINLTEGVFKCHHCNWKGSLGSYKNYKKPNVKILNKLSANVLKYFQEQRGISEDTLKLMKITEGVEIMPDSKDYVNTVQFNYYRDEELINIKYRTGNKQFKMFKDAELIFYNLDGIKAEMECIITEGEIDCLSYIEIGNTNVVSVPNGASIGGNLEYYKNCEEYFETKSKVFLSIDNDEPGIKLREELARRIGLDKCFIIKYPEGCKDANDVLVRHGADMLREILYNAKPIPCSDVIYSKDINELLLYDFEHGVSRGTTTYFTTLDNHFNWLKGEVTLFHGIPNHGKSKIVKQLCLLKSLKEGTKWAIFSPEEYPPTYFYSDLAHTLIGKNVNKKYNDQCSKEEFIEALEFIGKHFFYIYPETEKVTPVFINEKFKELISREGIHGGIIDPFNQLDNNFIQFGRDDYYLSDFLKREKEFALKHNFFKIIVAHPKSLKRNKEGKYDCPDVYDLSGGAMWANKCDNILAFHRPHFKDDFRSTECELHIQKIKKQALVGVTGMVKFNFDRKVNRYLEQNGTTPFNHLKLI